MLSVQPKRVWLKDLLRFLRGAMSMVIFDAGKAAHSRSDESELVAYEVQEKDMGDDAELQIDEDAEHLAEDVVSLHGDRVVDFTVVEKLHKEIRNARFVG